MYAPKIATAAALSLTSFSSTTTGFSSLRSVWPAFVTTATSSWSDGRLPLFGSCHLHQPKTNHGHSSPNSPRRVIITKRRMTTTSTTTGSSSSPSISNSATTTMTDVTTGATTSTTDTSERLENSERQHDIQGEFEWRDVLPMEKGSHNSSRIFIPSARVNDDDDDDVEDPFDDQLFRQRLESTLIMCQALGKSSLWVHVPMTRARLIEDMVALGLRFHHAERMTAVLNVWLKTDCQSKIPEYATHNVGVGAVVVNSRQQILVVREQRRNYMPWKTPTGLTELGESIDQAAEREVLEETGIATCFHSILGFRQTHGMTHGRSDLFFVCRLDPMEQKDDEGNVIIPEPVADETELECAKWIPMDDYRTMVFDKETGGHPMMQYMLNVLDAGMCIEQTTVHSVVPGRKPNSVYFPTS